MYAAVPTDDQDLEAIQIDAPRVEYSDPSEQAPDVCPPKYEPKQFPDELGDYILSPSGKLLQNYFAFEGFGDQHVVIYDRWIRMVAPINVAGRYLKFHEDTVICFEELRIFPPYYARDGKIYPSTPQLCREQFVTYGSDWCVDIVQRRGSVNGDEIARSKNVYIGTVPLMLKSCLCILRGKTPEQLAMLGEDPNDPVGFFIVDGAEKVILLQEQLSLNKIFLMSLDGETIIARMTSNTQRGTVLTEISFDVASNIIEMKFPSMKVKVESKGKDNGKMVSKSLNVLRLFRLFGNPDIEQIENIISNFIKPQWQRKCLLKLIGSTMDFVAFPNDVEEIARKLDKKNISPQDKDKETARILETDFFPHVNGMAVPNGLSEAERVERINNSKIYLLAAMVARLLEHLAGYRPLDDRDSWSNKRTEGAGRAMERLFRDAWRKTLSTIQGTIDGPRRTEFATIVEKIKSAGVITNSFHDSFLGSKWGVKGNQMKNNVAQTLMRDSVVATYAHINTIDVGISRTDRQTSLRLVQNSQWGLVDPIVSSEGNNCGLLKNTTILSKVTVETTDVNIIRILIGDNTFRLPEMVTYDILRAKQIGWNNYIMVNGKFLGWGDGNRIYLNLRERRRQNDGVPLEMSLILDDEWLYVDISPSRLVNVLLIVNDEQVDAEGNVSQTLAIDTLNLRGRPNYDLLSGGAAEYMSSWEQEFIKEASTHEDIIARTTRINNTFHELKRIRSQLYNEYVKLNGISPQVNEENVITYAQRLVYQDPVNKLDLQASIQQYDDIDRKYLKAKAKKPYSHCLVDPQSILSVPGNTIPWPEHNQAPRNTYQASMAKQALGTYHINHLNRLDGKIKTLPFAQRPIVDTEINSIIGLQERGMGSNVVTAMLALPNNEEDSFWIKKEFLENGGFRIQKYFVYKTEIKKMHNNVMEVLSRPRIGRGDRVSRYEHIQENGLPKIGAMLFQSDCIIGKMQTGLAGEKNASVFLKIGDEGIVDRVSVVTNNRSTIVTVKLRIMRIPEEGDKFAPRNAQKGTVGIVVPERSMPVDENGISPDMIANPHSWPSRMTASYPLEMIASKHGAMRGIRVNGSPFHPPQVNEYRETLRNYALEEFGYEFLRSGNSGAQFLLKVFMSLMYFQALKHHVKDKAQTRGIGGQVKPMTRQPPKGRANRGGLRFGEMERDSAISHGASSFLRERLMLASDGYLAVFCITCGAFAVNDAQGTYRQCSQCKGNSFGKCTIPYVYKLLTHLLCGIGINLRPRFVTPEEYARRLVTQKDVNDDAMLTDITRQLMYADLGTEDQLLEDREEQRQEKLGYLERDAIISD